MNAKSSSSNLIPSGLVLPSFSTPAFYLRRLFRFLTLLLITIISTLSISNDALSYEPLAKTGQSESLVDGDDGDIQAGRIWPERRFTDNQDGTLTDELTSLMWIKDADCATSTSSSASALHWKRAFDFTRELNTGALKITCDEYTQSYDDWRIPSVTEIGSLMRAGLDNKTIANWLNVPDNNSPGFTQSNIISNPIWTSTTSAENAEKAWIANLETGGFTLKDKLTSDQLTFIFSAVRDTDDKAVAKALPSGQIESYHENDDGHYNAIRPLPEPRFVKTDTGTVIDKLTGLSWMVDANCANPNGSNWFDAMASTVYLIGEASFLDNCSAYTETDDDLRNGWRLPNFNELKTLINYGVFSPALTDNHPFQLKFDMPFWTSTSSNNVSLKQSFAWSIDFSDGQINALTDKNLLGYTFPVSGPIDYPDIASNVSQLNFGSLFAGTEPSSKMLELKNSGTQDLVIDTMTITDSHFTFRDNQCQNKTLESQDSCTTEIIFSPSENKSYNANVIVKSDALGLETFTVPLTGSGINIEKEESNPNCFIATATYGTHLSQEVTMLKKFRDDYLLNSELGTKFVEFYYQTSPPIANAIESHVELRWLSRILLTPIIYGIKFPFITIICLSFLLIFFLVKFIRKTYLNEAFCRIMRAK